MDQKLLNLIPKRFRCPYCGEWHPWDRIYALGCYDSKRHCAQFECANGTPGYDNGDYRIYFSDGYCYYSTSPICGKARQVITGKIPIDSIIESTDKPTVTFDVPFTARHDVGSDECSGCNFKDKCICVKLGDEGDKRHMKITFGFEFDQSDLSFIALVHKEKELQEALARKEKELQELVQAIDRQERTLKEREDAVTSKEQISEQPQVKENKEDTTMENNIFNMNMEFGLNKDENIASTLMGVAVKNGDSWRIYNKKKKEFTELGDMQLGNLPIFILPTTKLREGDLIKDAGDYYFVTKVATPKTPTQTLSARTGEMKSIVPIKNILGFSCYSKVIALSDSLNVSDDFDVEKLAIMSAMFDQTGETGGQMNQLFPLMLFKDKFGGDDDTIKLMLMYSMMSSEGSGGQTNQVLPLMLLNDKLGGDDDTIKLMLMSSMMPSEGNGSQTNQVLPLMLFKDKFGGDDDTIKLMLMSSMMPSEGNGGQTNQVLPLMLFNDKLGGDDGIRNFILVSSMMDGNQAGSNNQMMNYLMLDLFMSKKDEKATKADDGVAK